MLLQGGLESITPLQLRHELGKVNEQFATTGHQDCQEVLGTLLNCLSEDMNGVNKQISEQVS